MRIINAWNNSAESKTKEFPTNFSDWEIIIDYEIAYRSAMEAVLFINSPLARRSNRELIQEVRDSIDFFEKIGEWWTAASLRKYLGDKIGEE